MFKIFIITFRETLEIAIILSLILVATQNIKGRLKYVVSGLIIGLGGAAAIAFFTGKISDMFHGYGQELVNAVILLLAASMIVWTVVWIRHGSKKISKKIKAYKEALSENSISLIPAAVITASSIFREGSEIVLFSYGVISATQEPLINLAIGSILGCASAATLGLLIYAGIIKMPNRYIFKTTTIMLSLIAAGMTAQAANLLSASEAITIFQGQVWDSSWLVSQESGMGRVLNVLIGYVENPTGIEMIFYGGTLLIIFLLSKLINKSVRNTNNIQPPPDHKP